MSIEEHIQKIIAERDELKAQSDYFRNGMAELQDYIDKMEPELLALKAQVEKLTKAITEISPGMD